MCVSGWSKGKRSTCRFSAPIYTKLDMDIASADDINGVKGVNIGSGMNSAKLTGEENSDEILREK